MKMLPRDPQVLSIDPSDENQGTAEHDRLAQRPAREQQETHCAAACLNRHDRRRFVAACQPGQLAGGDRPLLSPDNR